MKGKLVGIDELEILAMELVKASQGMKIWLFVGEMGSGKTTIIKHVCALLGVKERVSSPTFALINEYLGPAGSKIYHFDLCRLTKPSEAYDIGIEEYFDSGAYCFVEWPEVIKSIAPTICFKVAIQAATLSERIVDYTLMKP